MTPGSSFGAKSEFSLVRGEKLLLLGLSQSGKSTFFSLLAGILAPDRERFTMLRTDVAELSCAVGILRS
jgi:ABC-type lipoprotein export system ATPase subunit